MDGIFAWKVIHQIDNDSKTAKESSRLRMQLDKAQILARIGKKEAAEKLFETISRDLEEKGQIAHYSLCAGAMVEAGMATSRTLELAQKATLNYASGRIFDTLASVHAALGHYKEAVKFEQKALSMATRENTSQIFLRKLNAWKRLVKN